jgi:hypothetical protein
MQRGTLALQTILGRWGSGKADRTGEAQPGGGSALAFRRRLSYDK